MGKKINPKIFRQHIYGWSSKWFASKKDFPQMLEEDQEIRKFLKRQLANSGVSKTEIKRMGDGIELNIHTSKPGVIIGRKGQDIEKLRDTLKKQFYSKRKIQITVNIHEVKNPDADAELILQNIIAQIEKRVPFRRVLKRTIERTMHSKGVGGVKLMISGRLDGAEIARRETLRQGKIPAHTLRADLDYARSTAKTIYGTIGVKVWVYKGEIFDTAEETLPVEEKEK